MIRTALALLIAALVVAPAAAQTLAGPALTLSAAIQRAMETNPAIAAARLQRPIDVAGLAVAGERPNPEVAYEASKETPRVVVV